MKNTFPSHESDKWGNNIGTAEIIIVLILTRVLLITNIYNYNNHQPFKLNSNKHVVYHHYFFNIKGNGYYFKFENLWIMTLFAYRHFTWEFSVVREARCYCSWGRRGIYLIKSIKNNENNRGNYMPINKLRILVLKSTLPVVI